MTAIQAEVERRLAPVEPEVEVLLAEVVGTTTLRVFVDHPDGVSLDLCERVSGHLAPLRERYVLEVSSPGIDRPLTKPAHFRRFLGQRARVRMRGDRSSSDDRLGSRRSFTGELVGADDAGVTIAADQGVVTIGYDEIQRSNLLGE